MARKTIIVTGANGFAGQAVLARLSPTHQMIAVVRPGGVAPRSLAHAVIEWDLETTLLASPLPPIDVVIHLAGDPLEHDQLEPLWEKNVRTTDKMLRFCVEHNIDQVIFSSTSAVYGYGQEPLAESSALAPVSYYGLSKRFAEELCDWYERQHGIHTCILRLASLYGPGNTKGLIHSLLKSARAGHVVLRGSPESHRNSLYIDDFATLIEKIVSREWHETDRYNVAGPDTFSLLDIIDTIRALVPTQFQVDIEDENLVQNSVLDIQKATRQFDWVPRMSLRNGLGKMLSGMV